MTALPDAPPSASGRWRWLVACVAPALVLVAIVLPFLRFHEYSLLLPESMILLAGAAVLGAAIGAVSLLRPATLGPALMALLLGAFILCRPEINGQIILAVTTVADVTGNTGFVFGLVGAAIFLAVLAVCYLLAQHLQTIVAFVFGTFVVTALVLPAPTGGEPKISGKLPAKLNDLPPVIHIILDEHIGLAGVPSNIEGSAAADRAIRATYEDFALYNRAYSRFAETQFSLSALMNGEPGRNVVPHLELVSGAYVLRHSEWFRRLKEKGYALRIYQSSWLDMCGASVAADTCYTYPLYSINAVQRSPLPTLARLRVLLGKMHIGPEISLPSPLPANEAVELFLADLEQAPRGVAYIAHLMLPHFGYFYRADCSLADPRDWGDQPGRNIPTSLPTEREAAYRLYLPQAVCTERHIARLLERLKSLGVYDDATIIVHGDHGSRIGERTVHAPIETLTQRDLLDHYSTLAAIKMPGLPAGMHEESVALQQVFADAFLDGGAPTEPPGTVWLRNEETQAFMSRILTWPGVADEQPRSSAETASAYPPLRPRLE